MSAAVSKDVQMLETRLRRLEDEKRVSACMNRYMYLCDRLDADFNLDDLLTLFTEDAIWEGAGKRYDKTFGRHEGRAEISGMFAKYIQEPSHFVLNVHLLGNEQVEVEDRTASGSWLLLQASTFAVNMSWLNCARIMADFRYEAKKWRICHFRTENLFSRPVDKPWDDPTALPVPKTQ